MDKFKIKEYINKLSGKTKKLIIAGTVALVAFAVIMGIALNNRPYEVLFASVSSEEAKQIMGKLEEDGVPYQYQDGDILVPEQQVDVTKAKLVSEEYPKSGFTYDIFRENVNMMTTDSERQTLLLYELQDRIGATIKLFDGVSDARVTIALGQPQKYALDDDTTEASAQVVVTMKEKGTSPTKEQAASIQRLVSRSIPGLVIENVSVFDGNGREVSAVTADGENPDGKDGEEISQLIETQIEKKILTVLTPLYGSNNVRVAAKGKINMQKLLRESVTYQTPDKIDEQDKQGIVSEESGTREYSGDAEGAAGVAGAEANADIPQYNTLAEDANEAYGASGYDRKYLVNQIKEQGEIPPGILEDLTVSVAINSQTEGTTGNLQAAQIKELVGNAAGIAPEERETKVAVAIAPFYRLEDDGKEGPDKPTGGGILGQIPEGIRPFVVAGAVFALLALTLIVVLVRKRGKKKKAMKMAKAAGMAVPVARTKSKEEPAKPEINDEMLSMDDEKTITLRDNVRSFAEENPEISASLLKLWLNGGDNNGG